jgi:integrase/recombinase XerD
MASAKILLFSHKKLNDGTYPIVLQVIKDRKRKLISLGHASSRSQWDEANNNPNIKHPNYKDLNLLLQKKIYEANKVIIELDEKGDSYSAEDIVYKLKPKTSGITVFKYTDDLTKKLESNL